MLFLYLKNKNNLKKLVIVMIITLIYNMYGCSLMSVPYYTKVSSMEPGKTINIECTDSVIPNSFNESIDEINDYYKYYLGNEYPNVIIKCIKMSDSKNAKDHIYEIKYNNENNNSIKMSSKLIGYKSINY